MKRLKCHKIISIVLAIAMTVALLPAVGPTKAMAVDNLNATGYDSNGKSLAPIEAPIENTIATSTRSQLQAIRNNMSGNYHLYSRYRFIRCGVGTN